MAKTIKSATKVAKKTSKLPWLVWLIAVVTLSLWWSLYQSKWFITETLTIQGNSRLSVEQVTVASGVQIGKPLISQNIDDIIAKLIALPEIKSVKVERGWPTNLVITLAERQPIAVAASADGFILIDSEGINAGSVATPPAGLLVITAQPDSPAMGEAIKVLAALPTQWQVTGLVATSQDNVVVNLVSGAEVIFGTGDFAEQKVKVATALLDQNYLKINVAAPDAPSVK